MFMSGFEVYKKSGDVVHRRVAGESVLVPVRGNVADMQCLYALDEVAEYIWNCIDGESSAGWIAAKVAEKFDVDEETAERDAGLFIEDLLKHELVVQGDC
jgi:hypothetical protein